VLDGVCVVWASLLEDSLEVVYRRPYLALAVACDGRDTHHAGAARFLIVAAITVDHGYDRLKKLLKPLLAAPSALFGILDGNVGRRPLSLIGVATFLPWVGQSSVASLLGNSAA
jgi:hypothetical protein